MLITVRILRIPAGFTGALIFLWKIKCKIITCNWSLTHQTENEKRKSHESSTKKLPSECWDYDVLSIVCLTKLLVVFFTWLEACRVCLLVKMLTVFSSQLWAITYGRIFGSGKSKTTWWWTTGYTPEINVREEWFSLVCLNKNSCNSPSAVVVDIDWMWHLSYLTRYSVIWIQRKSQELQSCRWGIKRISDLL